MLCLLTPSIQVPGAPAGASLRRLPRGQRRSDCWFLSSDLNYAALCTVLILAFAAERRAESRSDARTRPPPMAMAVQPPPPLRDDPNNLRTGASRLYAQLPDPTRRTLSQLDAEIAELQQSLRAATGSRRQ